MPRVILHLYIIRLNLYTSEYYNNEGALTQSRPAYTSALALSTKVIDLESIVNINTMSIRPQVWLKAYPNHSSNDSSQ
jgi:hypothetical protein